MLFLSERNAVVLAVLGACSSTSVQAAAGQSLRHAPNLDEVVGLTTYAHVNADLTWTSATDEAELNAQETDNKSPKLVHASFKDGLFTTGWGVLKINSSSAFNDNLQGMGAGLIEGVLTAKHIYPHYKNLMLSTFKGEPMQPPVEQWLLDQETWTMEMVKTHGGSKDTSTDKPSFDPFWKQVGVVMSQLKGLEEGYNHMVKQGKVPHIPHVGFLFLNGLGDLFDIMPAVLKSERTAWDKLNATEAEMLHQSQGHCSAIVKVPGDLSDMFFGHSSWFSYAATNRIFKYYSLALSEKSNTAATTVSFSSYPGFLMSLDDFYQSSAGLGMLQTTNGVLDHSIYDGVITHKSLLAWQRVRVAMNMASSGREWRDVFSRHASGTYANQYMIVDLKRFTPGQPLKSDTLWVVEEMPGLIVGKDQSPLLEFGYWPSYNIPFYESIWEKSGYLAMVKRTNSTYFTHALAPRAKIFRRDQGKVNSIDGIKRILRYNDFQNDKLSFNANTKKQDPMYAICSRGDLASGSAKRAGGCYDTKVSSFSSWGGPNMLHAEIINGPTRGNHASDGSINSKIGLPAFSWDQDTAFDGMHKGLPERYEFGWVTVTKEGKADELQVVAEEAQLE